MTSRTGAQALWEALAGEGVDTCFANPGTTELDLVRALETHEEIRCVVGLQENVCTGGADGYGRMTKSANFSAFHIRKWYLQIEDTLAGETGAPADGDSLRKIVIAACIHNPFAGKFVQDLSPWIDPSPELGREFGRRIQEAAQGRAIESYGKAVVVGIDGEYEHGNALLTNPAANPIRDAIGGGKSWVPSSGKRGGPGTVIDIPLAHKDALYVRSHYDTITAQFADGPNRDEVIVIWAFATRGRLNARLGGLKASEVKGQDGLV